MAVSSRRLTRLAGTIGSTETKTVDATSLERARGTQLLVSVYNRTLNKTKNFTMSLGISNGEALDQIFNKIGDSISIEVESIINGSSVEIHIKNNEGYSLDYAITKLVI